MGSNPGYLLKSFLIYESPDWTDFKHTVLELFIHCLPGQNGIWIWNYHCCPKNVWKVFQFFCNPYVWKIIFWSTDLLQFWPCKWCTWITSILCVKIFFFIAWYHFGSKSTFGMKNTFHTFFFHGHFDLKIIILYI